MSDLATNWWVWIAAALALAILEVFAPGFVFLGFSIGAALVGLMLMFTTQSFSLPMLFLIFAVFSLVAWLALRRIFKLPGERPKTFDHDIND